MTFELYVILWILRHWSSSDLRVAARYCLNNCTVIPVYLPAIIACSYSQQGCIKHCNLAGALGLKCVFILCIREHSQRYMFSLRLKNDLTMLPLPRSPLQYHTTIREASLKFCTFHNLVASLTTPTTTRASYCHCLLHEHFVAKARSDCPLCRIM